MLNLLLTRLLGILRLRAGPQDLPASWTLTSVLVAIYLGVGMATGRALGDGEAVARSLAMSALQIVALTALLYARRLPERLSQTLSALAGTGTVLGLLAFGFLLQADPNVNQPLLGLAWFAIFIWSLVVDAHIYRHALGVNMSLGMLVAVLMLAASYVLTEVLF